MSEYWKEGLEDQESHRKPERGHSEGMEGHPGADPKGSQESYRGNGPKEQRESEMPISEEPQFLDEAKHPYPDDHKAEHPVSGHSKFPTGPQGFVSRGDVEGGFSHEESTGNPCREEDHQVERREGASLSENLGYPDSPHEDSSVEIEESLEEKAATVRRLTGAPKKRGRRLAKPSGEKRKTFTPQQRLLILDTWKRSGLPARDFSSICGVSPHSLYTWNQRFEKDGPAGLMDKPKGPPRGSSLSDITKRTILMLKESHPEYGCERISNELLRGPALGASPTAVARVLHEAGYVLEEKVTHPHPDRVRRFERENPNQMWQTDIFTFMLKRQNRRVYLVGFMDDHSRFMVGYSLDPGANTTMVINTLRTGISNYQAPESILTDNGPQYVTWKGKSAFSKECEHRGIKQIVARPRHPRTLGKIERFWGTLWRGLVETAIFEDLEDARKRIGLFMDHYNFQRPHTGIKGLTPAERYFGVSNEVLKTLKVRVQANALEIARNGIPKKSFYLAGQVDGEPFSLHAQGGKFYMKKGDGEKHEVDLKGEQVEAEDAPEAICPDGSPPVDPVTDHAPIPGDTQLSDGLSHLASSLEKEDQGDGES